MNIREFISNLSSKMELHSDNDLNDDAGSLLEMLFDIYTDLNGFDNEIIRKDFGDLDSVMNGMTLQEMDKIIYPVCALCWDHEKTAFIEGVKVGARLKAELEK